MGCGHTGLHPGWFKLGAGLRGLGIDASDSEIERLRAALPDDSSVQYRAAWLGLPAGHPLAPTYQQTRPDPISRLLSRTAALAFDTLRAGSPQPPFAPPIEEPRWRHPLPPPPPVTTPSVVLREAGLSRFDFLKIDLDGPDLTILRGLAGDGLLQQAMGVKVEAQLLPNESPDSPTLAAIDALLAPMGFRAHAVLPARYSNRALPLPFNQRAPGTSRRGGRLVWADVLYLRQPSAGDTRAALVLAAIAAIFDLPDLAAAALQPVRMPGFDHDAALHALAMQAEARHRFIPEHRAYCLVWQGQPGLPPSRPGIEAALRLLDGTRPLCVVEVHSQHAARPPLCLPADWPVPMRTIRVPPEGLAAALDQAPDLLRFAGGSATRGLIAQALAHPAARDMLGLETGFSLAGGDEPGLAWLLQPLAEAGFDIADAVFDRRQAPLLSVPGQPFGSCDGGQVLFLRDACANHAHLAAHAMTTDALRRAAAMLVSAGLADWAAELLLCWRERLPLAVPPLLDLLAACAQPAAVSPLDYAGWMAAIRDDPARFFDHQPQPA